MFAASRRHFDSHFGSFGKKGDLSVARSTLNLVLGGFYRDFHCTVYRFKPAALPYREWTTSEEEQLKDLTTQRCSPSNIALVLGRTEVSVKEHIRWMRKTTSSDKNKKYWTREENEILLKLDREGKILAQIAEALPLRTYRAVSNQRSILKSQKAADVSNTCVSTGWTDEQDQLLLQLYDQQVPAQTIVKRTGKNFGQVRNRLRIVRPGAPGRELKRWSGEDVEKLLDLNSQGQSNAAIALVLKRSIPAVKSRLREHRRAKRVPTKASKTRLPEWTAEEVSMLIKLKQRRVPWPEIAAAIPTRSLRSLHNRWHLEHHRQLVLEKHDSK